MKIAKGVSAMAGRIRPVMAPVPACLLAALLLGGCMGGDGGRESSPGATRSATDPAHPPATDAAQLTGRGQVISPLIDDLRGRQSILPAGSPYRAVADAVLAAGASSVESELRVKRLTARARSKNWLPGIGPDVSLTSLGQVAASLLLNQTLLDNGRRRAERDFAAADVEVAAVTLVTDQNRRVHDALKLYLDAERGRELAAITREALSRMAEFERITRIRREGGLADGAEYRIVLQKQSEMQAALSSEEEGAAAARAELEALASRPMGGVKGLAALPPDAGAPEPLPVMLARGEAARTAAEVRVARSGLFPGFGAKAALDRDGDLNAGLALDANGFGFGRGDNLKALAEAEEAAHRRVDEAGREANRKIVALGHEIAALEAERAQGAKVLAGMEANLKLFTEQYRAGGRSLLDLVGQFESVVAMRRDQATLKYRIAAARLDIALLRGVLVDGARI